MQNVAIPRPIGDYLTNPIQQAFVVDVIDRQLYPELNLILWDRADRFIPANEAFAAYEQRWRHVDQNNLSDNERTLIAELTRTIGKGLFLIA